jgi:hypothetical protein
VSIDELLQLHPTLWRARGARSAADGDGLSTGCSALDQSLPGGGWPKQGLVEILTDRHGIGELSLLMPALTTLCGNPPSQAVEHGGWIVFVSPPYQPYAPALAARGLDLRRVLVVQGATSTAWVMEQTLRSRACSAILGWVDPRDLQILRRLQLAADQVRCLTVLLRPLRAAQQPSPAVLRIALQTSHDGLYAQILKSRGGAPARILLGHPDLAWRCAAQAQEASAPPSLSH